jgi:hypothetical protein
MLTGGLVGGADVFVTGGRFVEEGLVGTGVLAGGSVVFVEGIVVLVCVGLKVLVG